MIRASFAPWRFCVITVSWNDSFTMFWITPGMKSTRKPNGWNTTFQNAWKTELPPNLEIPIPILMDIPSLNETARYADFRRLLS